MAGFRRVIAACDSNDLGEYDRLVAVAKRAGVDALHCGSIAEITAEQHYDPKDPWLAFLIINSGMMKFVETDVINGIFSRDTLEKNARLLAEKSRILARHGMKGALRLLEPQVLPESFYRKRPELRGAACYNPCLALSRYYSPCLDRGEILAHYREAARKLLEIAPEIAVLTLGTNDSGAGVCWCTGLYPGPNGPEACRDTTMGERIRKWMQAILDGARDAGREIDVFFNHLHFSRDETRETLEKLPERAGLTIRGTEWPNVPELEEESRYLINRSNELGRDCLVSVDPAVLGWKFTPLTGTPFTYFNFDVMRTVARSGATGITVGGIGREIHGAPTPTTRAILSGLHDPPETDGEIAGRVEEIAREHAPADVVDALVTAWRACDRAVRCWPSYADTNHKLNAQYSILGDRWLVRPIVPVPEKLTEDEKASWEKFRSRPRDPKDEGSFFISEGVINYKPGEFRWLVPIYENIMGFMDMAVEVLREAGAPLGAQDAEAKRFDLQYRRIAMLRAFLRTQRNFLSAGSIIEYFTGPEKGMFFNPQRIEDTRGTPESHKHRFLEAVDDEIENCREIIKLIEESDVPLIATGEVETRFTLPADLAGLLEKKIAAMEAHKGDIDDLFPGVGPDRFEPPDYAWADVNKESERGKRARDRERMGDA